MKYLEYIQSYRAYKVYRAYRVYIYSVIVVTLLVLSDRHGLLTVCLDPESSSLRFLLYWQNKTKNKTSKLSHQFHH